MKKYIFILIAVALIATSCSNDGKSNTDKSKVDNTEKVKTVEPQNEEATIINLADFDTKAADYVGKKVKFKGIVDHVCTHGGQKLFVVDEGSDARIKVTPDDEIAAFNADLVGNKIMIEGIVEEQVVDEDYLREWEEEIKAGSADNDKKDEKHLGGKVEQGGENADVSQEMEKVNNLRKMIKDSGTDHISFYSVVCSSYKVDTEKPAETK